MKFFLIIFSFILTACTSTKAIFILPQDTPIAIKKSNKIVAVATVKLPSYLDNETILIQEGNKINSLDAKFIALPSELFTQKAIVFFKRALSNPNVYHYPWEIEKKEGILVNITIDNVIYKDNMVILSGSYYLEDLQKNHFLVKKNYYLTQKAKKDASKIVVTLNKLYNTLLTEITYKIAR